MAADLPPTRFRLRKIELTAPSPTTIAIGACMLLALTLRVLLARRSGIWRDEAQFLWIVRMPSIGGMLDFLWHHESHPPLFYFTMRFWLGIFGDTEAAALSLPIMLGVLLVPMIYLVAAHTFSRRTGLIAALLAALSPVLASHSALVRPYSLLPLLCLSSVYLLWRGLSGGSWRTWTAYAAVTLAMLLTHNWAWMVLGAQWIVTGTWFIALGWRRSTVLTQRWLLAQIAVLVGYAPWITIFLFQARHAGYDAYPVVPREAIHTFVLTTTSLPIPFAASIGLSMLIGSVLQYATHRNSAVFSRNSDAVLALVLYIGIPIVAFTAAAILSAKTSLVMMRCLTALSPCVLLVMAYGVASLPSIHRVATGVLAFAYLVFSLSMFDWAKSNAREIAAVVSARAHPKDLVIISPPWLISSCSYYFPASKLQMIYPFAGSRGAICYDNLRDRLLASEPMSDIRTQLTRAFQEGRRVWLVTDDDTLRFESQIQGNVKITNYGNLLIGRTALENYINIKNLIIRIYGSPGTNAAPRFERAGDEILRVYLYSRSIAPQTAAEMTE